MEVTFKLNSLNTVIISGKVLDVRKSTDPKVKEKFMLKVSPAGYKPFALQCKLDPGSKLPAEGDKVMCVGNIRFNELKNKYTLNVSYWNQFAENIDMCIVEVMLLSRDNTVLTTVSHNVSRKSVLYHCPLRVNVSEHQLKHLENRLDLFKRYYIEGTLHSIEGLMQIDAIHIKSAETIPYTTTL